MILMLSSGACHGWLGGARCCSAVERVIVAGLNSAPASVTVGGQARRFTYDADAHVLTVHAVGVRVGTAFKLVIA